MILSSQLCSREHLTCISKTFNKPVGFYGPIAPPVPNAPISRICGQNSRNDADATFLNPHIRRRLRFHAATPPVLPLHATIGGRLPQWQTSKCISSVSFVRIESIFYNTQETQTEKNHEPEFWNSNSVIFDFFWNSQKGVARSLCGRSGPLWSRPN